MDPWGMGGFTYLPIDGYVGTDSFKYSVADEYDNPSDLAIVTIDVKPALPQVATIAIDKITPGAPGGVGWVSAHITSDNTFKAGAPIDAYVAGQKAGNGVTNKNGDVSIRLTLPGKVGNFPLTITSGTQSTTDSIRITRETPVVTSLTLGVPAGKPGRTVYLVAHIGSPSADKTGAIVDVYIDGTKVATALTDTTGMAKIPVKLPAVAGKHTVRVNAGGKSTTKTIILGKGVTAKISKPKSVKAKKTQTIAGSFGYTSGKVTITVIDPKGKVTTRTVSLNSKGKFSYKYKTGKKGSYTVTINYKANAHYYGTKTFTARFTAK